GEAVRGIGAAAEAVIGMEQRHAALPRRRLIAERVADEDGVPEPVALDQHLQIGRLGEPGVAPALEVPKEGAEPGPSLKRLDVTGLAVAHDEERIARGQPSKPDVDVGKEIAAALADEAHVLDRGLRRERDQMRLRESGEDVADA